MTKRVDSLLDQRDLKTIKKLISNNWYVVIIGLLLSAMVAYLYTYKLPDIFAARAQVLLKSGETYDYQQGLFRGLGYSVSYENISNQQRILTSYNLLDKTISKLNIDVSYFIVGRLRTTEVYQAMPFDVEVHYLDDQLYEQPVNFRIEDNNTFSIQYELNDETVSGTYNFNSNVDDKYLFIRVNKTPLLDSTIKTLREIDYQFVVHSRPNLIYKYMAALNIDNLEYTTVLELTLEDQIASRAVSFLDTLCKEYIDYTLQSQIDINENTLTYIDKQLDEVVDILAGIEDDLENYRMNKSILNLSMEEELYLDKYFEYDGEKRALMLELKSIDALERYIKENQGAKSERLLPPGVLLSEGDVFLRNSIGELYKLQINRNNTLFEAKEANISVEKIDEQIESLKKDILIYLFNLKKAISGKIEGINIQINQYQDRIKSIPKTQRDILNIDRKLQVNEKMYLYLLEKKANTIIARAGIIPETRLIETARSIGKVKPDKSKIFRYFLVAGLLLSLLIVVIRHFFFSRIESMDDLKAITNFPIFGEIIYSPNIASGKSMVSDESPKAPITESFRGLRTNLDYVVSDEKSRIFLITSHSPGEGKTFCSLNLAGIMAKAGKKVLLLELDLHKPKVRKDLGMTTHEDRGASTVLAGKHQPEEVIIPSAYENLDLILAGPTPPNASELILNKRMKDLLDFGKANYDFVVIDSAPIGLISDAIVLMKFVDVTLFIVNTRVAKAEFVQKAEELVVGNELKNFGFVLNGVKLKKSRFYYNYSYGYRYGYSYGYGYGYGSGNDGKEIPGS